MPTAREPSIMQKGTFYLIVSAIALNAFVTFGFSAVLMAPLAITEAELRRLVEITAAAVAEVTSATGNASLATAA